MKESESMKREPAARIPGSERERAPARDRPTTAFWILAGLLVLYVAVCTGHRDLMLSADAWEHHRVIKALTGHLWRPGNPTFATDEPSVRYSPYMVLLAVISRATGVSAYHVLSGAAVFNTALLMMGILLFSKGLGHARAAASAVIIMVSLYGGAPGYANSYALADLPWHEVNPSAFAFGWALVMWSLLLWVLRGGPRVVCGAAIAILLAMTMLDHAMTGSAALVGLAVLAGCAEKAQRRMAVTLVLCALAAAGVACLAWPWYSFAAALRRRPDDELWYNAWILRTMLTRWCAPGIVLSLFSLTCEDRRAVRILFWGGLSCLALGGLAMLVHSAALARLPLPGLVFAHLALAVFADQAGILRLRTWPGRLAALVRRSPAPPAPIMEIVLAIVVVGFLVPQLDSIVHEPHLARTLLERMVGRRALHPSLREQLDRLLAPVGERDVVLSDPSTSWAIPSSRGRIVTAIHYELFVPGQPQRARDVDRFFGEGLDDERISMLGRYHVQWILLDRAMLAPALHERLLDRRAVVGSEGTLTLMDARIWQRDRASLPPA